MSALFPPPDECIRVNDALTCALADADARLTSGSVTPTFDDGQFKRELEGFDFSKQRVLDDVLSWTIAQMECGLVHVTHPRYFGLFNPAPTFAAQCADRIAATFNPQLATARTSPAAVAIERHVIGTVIERCSLPATSVGHFTTGGSEANYTALVCALAHLNNRFARDGVHAFDGVPVFYVSTDAHLAWLKLAVMAGIGRAAVRLVATDGMGQINTTALDKEIEADRASGRVPVMVVATAGTTNAGMIDSLDACAAVARRHRLWFHVDAAWGGALIASRRLSSALAGLGEANSVTIDAHKWFATTMGCGMFLTAHSRLLPTIFNVSTSFMPSEIAGVDPYLSTVQWSRRFAGLRFFLALAVAGWDGYAAHVEHAIYLARLAKDLLAQHGWRTLNNSPTAVLCIVPPEGGDQPRDIVARVLSSGRAWIAVTTFEGRDVVRICFTHGESTRADVEELVRVLCS